MDYTPSVEKFHKKYFSHLRKESSMNRFYCFTALLLASLAPLAAQEWRWANPKPIGNDFVDSYFLNSTTAIAVGKGMIVKTTDGGISWKQISVPGVSTVMDFRAIFFLNNTIGWIVGPTVPGVVQQNILKTTDGGNTWKLGTIDIAANVRSVFFRSENLGWAVGDNGKISKTTNGGTSWTQQTSGGSQQINKVWFANDTVGITFGNSSDVRRTTDGGATWSYVTTGFGSNINSCYFFNSDSGYILGNSGKLAKTVDGGKTWTLITGLSTSSDFKGMHFIDNQNGFILRAIGLYKTANSGATWDRLYTPIDVNYDMYTFRFFDINNGIILGRNGVSAKTSDGGVTWIMLSSGPTVDMKCVRFSNANVGHAVGYNNSGSTYGRTTDGGKTWVFTSNTFTKPITIFFVNENYGWVVSNTGGLSKTTDGGITWTSQTTGSSDKIASAFFVDTLRGWLIGSTQLLKTTDGGRTWSASNNMGGTSVWFLDSSNGLRADQITSKLNKTTDGGATWTPTTTNCTKIFFIDSQNGWSLSGVGISPNVYLTTDGGTTWTSSNGLPSTGVIPNQITFANKTHGWIVCGSGIVYRTTDGGKTWTNSYSGTGNDLNDVDALDTSSIWISGASGTILTTSSAGGTSVKEIDRNVPHGYSLAQNYPNPFNPSTEIRFQVPEVSHVSLKVYDILGKEVATLVNEQLVPGSYTTQFTARNLSSGMYFYRLRTGSFVETKRMLLLK